MNESTDDDWQPASLVNQILLLTTIKLSDTRL